MLIRISIFALVFALAGCAGAAATEGAGPVSLRLAWRLAGPANPESVALAADGAMLYVTNVNGEGDARDGNGFISRVSIDGRMIQRDWVTGLDGPKGIASDGATLYVADISQLVAVDAKSGAILSRTALPDAGFLNDVAVAPDGRILVADSDRKRIYAVKNGAPSVWAEGDLLTAVNGLLPEHDSLVVTTMAGRLLAMDYTSGAITVLAEGLGDADGVARLPDGRYLVSEWPGLMHVVNRDGSHVTIMDTKVDKRLLNDFLLVGDTLYLPHWDPGEFSAYRIVSSP